MLVLPLFMAVAFGQQEVCSQAYSHELWEADLDAVEEALSQTNLKRARELLRESHKQTLCLQEPARPSYVARLARQLTITFFFSQDEEATRRWSLAAEYADPSLGWPSDLGESHVLRQQIAAFPPSTLLTLDEGLLVPKKGALLVNGKPLLTATAPVEVPFFVQVADKRARIVLQYWQDGAAFPKALLDPKAGKLSPPRWYVPETPAQRTALNSPLLGDGDIGPPPLDPLDADAPAPSGPDAVTPSYVDPFLDARLRAVERQTTVREENDRTVTTEVITFVEDTGPATAVTQEDFAAWLAYRPTYQPAHIDPKLGSRGYLKNWKNNEGPEPSAPVTWVPFPVAKLYCDDWGDGLASVRANGPAPALREWRLSDEGNPVIVGPGLQHGGDPTTTAEDLGFRCRR